MNTSVPKYTLNKKHNFTNNHVVSEAATVGILCVGKKDTATNLADLLKKFMPYSQNNQLLGQILFDY